jgi:hypothetical protein
MKTFRRLWLLGLVALVACADGGPVGTGISSSSVSGTIVAVDTTGSGSAASLEAPVRVSLLEAPDVATTTDPDGNFDLVGDFSGSLTLRFTAPQAEATAQLEVPLATEIDLGDIRLRPGAVTFNKPQVRQFFGQVAFIDCAPNPRGAAELLVNDRKATANQFMIRIWPATVLVRANGDDAVCSQLKPGDGVAIEGVLQTDRTIGAITIVISPPPPGEQQPVTRLRFSGTIAIINCESGNVQLFDDATGQSRLRLSDASGLVDPALDPLECSDLQPGDQIAGTGLAKARRPEVIEVVTAVVRSANAHP